MPYAQFATLQDQPVTLSPGGNNQVIDFDVLQIPLLRLAGLAPWTRPESPSKTNLAADAAGIPSPTASAVPQAG